MPMDEGYIKFQPVWTKSAAFSAADFADLLTYREHCFKEQWIGVYPDGIGFGNISQRSEGNDFYISGSATGGLANFGADQVSKVNQVKVEANKLWCSGPLLASSESMSHAIIYEKLPWVQGVIHVHDRELWTRLLHRVPTTAADAPYGSPEMVLSISRLIDETDLPHQKLFVMEGHEEGIFAFGKTLAEAFTVLCKFRDADSRS